MGKAWEQREMGEIISETHSAHDDMMCPDQINLYDYLSFLKSKTISFVGGKDPEAW